MNGSVRGFAFGGISGVGLAHVRDVVVSGNGSFGLSPGQNTIVSNAIAEGNGGTGILGSSNLLYETLSRANQTFGISVGHTLVLHSASRANGGRGVQVLDGSLIGVSSSNNGLHGMYTVEACLIVDATIRDNGSVGLFQTAGGALMRSNASANFATDLSLWDTAYFGNTTSGSLVPDATAINLGQNACAGALCP